MTATRFKQNAPNPRLPVSQYARFLPNAPRENAPANDPQSQYLSGFAGFVLQCEICNSAVGNTQTRPPLYRGGDALHAHEPTKNHPRQIRNALRIHRSVNILRRTANARKRAQPFFRSRRKLTASFSRMPYFSRTAAKAAPMGRPLSEPVRSFTSILFARLHGYSRKRAHEIISENPDAASGLLWNLASSAHADGCATTADFEAWLQKDFCRVVTEQDPAKTL